MKPEDTSRAKLVDQLRELKAACDSAIRIAENKQYIKANRINSLYKKRHEIATAYQHTIRYLNDEIRVTRYSEDYSRTLPARSSDQQG